MEVEGDPFEGRLVGYYGLRFGLAVGPCVSCPAGVTGHDAHAQELPPLPQRLSSPKNAGLGSAVSGVGLGRGSRLRWRELVRGVARRESENGMLRRSER